MISVSAASLAWRTTHGPPKGAIPPPPPPSNLQDTHPARTDGRSGYSLAPLAGVSACAAGEDGPASFRIRITLSRDALRDHALVAILNGGTRSTYNDHATPHALSQSQPTLLSTQPPQLMPTIAPAVWA